MIHGECGKRSDGRGGGGGSGFSRKMFDKSEATSVAGFEATLNEFSRLKANLILVLKFQIVT